MLRYRKIMGNRMLIEKSTTEERGIRRARRWVAVWLGVVMLPLLAGCGAPQGKTYRFSPLELKDPPVNGTDETETPARLREIYGFGDRPSKKMVEHGATPALLETTLDALETPHIDWADAYSEAPIRVLWVVEPRRGLRDIIEIRQRSNFDITPLMLPDILLQFPTAPALNAFFRKRYDEILSRPYDVIVLHEYNMLWSESDSDVSPLFRRIEQKVRDGCGAVCQLSGYFHYKAPETARAAYARLSPLRYGGGGMRAVVGMPGRTGRDSPVTDGISFAPWPACSLTQARVHEDAHVLAAVNGHPVVATGRFGDGRVAAFHFTSAELGDTGLIPAVDSETAPMFGNHYEAVYAAWLRAIVWAAGKPPRIGLRAAEVTPCDSGTAPRIPIRLTAEPGAPDTATLRVDLTDEYGDRLFSGKTAFQMAAGTEKTVTPELPALHADGVYRLDLLVQANGVTYNWGTAAIRVAGGPALSVRPDGPAPGPGDPMRYRAIAAGAAGTLRVLAVDGNDRVFFDQTSSFTNEAAVTVSTTLSRLPVNRVFFTLRAPGTDTLLARRAVRLVLPRIGRKALDGQFAVLAYGRTQADEHLKRYAGLLYRAAGFNGIYFNNHGRGRLQSAAEEGLFSVCGKSWQFPQKGFAKIHKWTPNDPAKRSRLVAHIEEDVADIKAYGSIGRVLDDESWFAFTGSRDGEVGGAQLTQDRWSLELFREAMRDKYGTIEALNDMWGTDFAGFEDVRAIEEDEVRDTDNPSGWLEFREYMNWTYASRYYGWVNEQHKQRLGEDFGAGCGAPHWTTSEGGPVYRGGDMRKMAGNMDFMMLYGGGSPSYGFVGQPGGQKYDPPQNWRDYGSWSHLLTGADALWYYFGNAIIGSELAWRRHAVWVRDGIADIVRGCGELVSGARAVSDRSVRMLSTSENQHMGWLYFKRDDDWRALRLHGGQPQSARTFRRAMGNAFVPVGDIDEEAIAEGALHDGCRLLFLPQQLNVGDAAAAAIREYVRQGGTVAADILPAMNHRMGKPRGESALADVFGVNLAAAALRVAADEASGVEVQRPPGAAATFVDRPMRLPGRVACVGVTPTTAVPHARIELSEGGRSVADGCFINAFGQGRALLLNFVYGGFGHDTLDAHAAFMQAVLKLAQIPEPAERIVDPQSAQPLPYRPLYRFTRGKAELLGSIRGSFVGGNNPRLWDPADGLETGDRARFTWSGPRHAYDVRGGRYLGFGESAAVDLPPFEGRLLSLLPYRVTRLSLHAPRRAAAGSVVTVDASIETDGEAPGEHVLFFEVTSPSGAARPLYARTRIAPGGRVGFAIPFAWNDPAGIWVVHARDVMTGIRSDCRIRLR